MPHCFAAFGFGGRLLVSFPDEPQQWSVGEQATGMRSSVRLESLAPILQTDSVNVEPVSPFL